jgi:deoxyribonuclease-1
MTMTSRNQFFLTMNLQKMLHKTAMLLRATEILDGGVFRALKESIMRHFILNLIAILALVACDSPSAQQAVVNDYDEAKKLFWGILYARGGETLYCGQPFGSNKGRQINVEHVLPMSWVMKKLNCKDRDSCRRNSKKFRLIEADLHNLYPSRRDINQIRSSFPFGIVRGEPRHYGKCDFELDKKSRMVEPRTEVRGEIARAMFYMHERYGVRLHRRMGKLLKQWNRQDPPDGVERKRNDSIEKIQGNRNRFIDQPIAADRLRF